MRRQFMRLAVAVGVLGALSQPLAAQQNAQQGAAATAQSVDVCALVPKEEVKKHIPWRDLLDQFPVEGEPVGATGANCNYPTVHVQVLSFSQGTIDALRKSGPLESIPGIGDEAYFRNNRDRYAELMVRVGSRLLTLQGDVPPDGTIESIKPGVLSLAKVFVAKLR